MAETAADPTIAWGCCLVLLVLSLATSFPVASQAGYAQIPRPAPVGCAVLVGKQATSLCREAEPRVGEAGGTGPESLLEARAA